MPDRDKGLETVRKLLAKAENPAVTEAEAELYNLKAAELIARYGIDDAVLADSGQSADEIDVLRIDLQNPYSRDKASLLTNIAFPLRCRTLIHRLGQGVGAVTVFGFRSDLARVELLFTSLLLQANTQLSRVRPDEHAVFIGESLAAYRRTWLTGFGRAVHDRLARAEEGAAREHVSAPGERSVALVVQDRMATVRTAFDEAYGDMRTAPPRRLSGSGYQAGHHAGTQATLDPAAITRRLRALPAR